MLKAVDVANFFIDMANNDPDDCMTNLRLNKLLYFAQAWSLIRNHKPLFNEDIQAWKYGPVIPSVYKTFKPCGRERIASVSDDNFSMNKFSTDELQLLIDILEEYGQYSSPALVKLTHSNDGPWKKVYDEYSNEVITQDSLINYFSKKQPLKTFQVPKTSECDFVGYRDKQDGLLILPKEYDDDN